MIRITKIGHATFETPDLSRQVDYYRDILGLRLLDRTSGEAVFACPSDSRSIIMRSGSTVRCSGIALEVASGIDAPDIVATLGRSGIAGHARRDPSALVAESVVVENPDGIGLEIIPSARPSGEGTPNNGIGPRKLGHIAFKVNDVARTAAFFVDALGFRISDWMGDFFAFLRCGPDHHTLNFLHGQHTKLHHIAFELENWDHIRRASDFLAKHKFPIIWGPGRHGIGHNIFIYHRDPDGQIIELYTELDQMSSEDLGYFDPRPWHADNPQIPKVWDPGLPSNVWGPSLPDGFREG